MGSPPRLQGLGSSCQVSPSVGKSLGREEALGPTGTQKQSSMLPVTEVLTTYVLMPSARAQAGQLRFVLSRGACRCWLGLAGGTQGWRRLRKSMGRR